jgi:nitrate reductase NapAB chaperone NapD
VPLAPPRTQPENGIRGESAVSVSARDVIKLIDDWHPRGCKTEKDFERSLHRHLEKKLEKSDVIMQYASGRVKGDICVDHTVLIEIKDSLKSTGQLQRLLGQLEIYDAQWKGKVVVVICGDTQRDLLKQLDKKVESLKPGVLDIFAEQKIFLVVRGVAPVREEKAGLWL